MYRPLRTPSKLQLGNDCRWGRLLFRRMGRCCFKKFSAAEDALASCNIPLIILIGPATKTLNGIIHHTRPLEVFYEESASDNVLTGTLTRHPYPWPGRVISITELSELHAAGQLAC